MVLPHVYGLTSVSRSWLGSQGQFCAIDSGANIFLFPPVFALPGTLTPSSHCLTSATSGPAIVPLSSAEVMFGLRDSMGMMQMFRQRAFIHHDISFALLLPSLLGEKGCYFDFYGTLTLVDGLHLADLCIVSSDSYRYDRGRE